MQNSLDKNDYMEPCCPFDTDFYKEPTEMKPTGHISVSEMIAQIDRLTLRGDKAAIERVLKEYERDAKAFGDIRGELTVQNELIGHYRMANNREKGLAAVERALELLKNADMSGSVSLGTILLNAATALRAFGESERALPLYADACRAYADHLPAEDVRFAGLYNNMASAYDDIGEVSQAENYYNRAISILKKHPEDNGCMLDMAVSYLNLALHFHSYNSEDERITEYADKAVQILESPTLSHDGYFAHTAEKCADGFSYLGYFFFGEKLKTLAEEFYSARA